MRKSPGGVSCRRRIPAAIAAFAAAFASTCEAAACAAAAFAASSASSAAAKSRSIHPLGGGRAEGGGEDASSWAGRAAMGAAGASAPAAIAVALLDLKAL